MWDVNLRFKSLPNTDASIVVIGVHVISDVNDQPFMENVTGSDGKAE